MSSSHPICNRSSVLIVIYLPLLIPIETGYNA